MFLNKDIQIRQVSHFKAMAILGKLFFGMKKSDPIEEESESSSEAEDGSDDEEESGSVYFVLCCVQQI